MEKLVRTGRDAYKRNKCNEKNLASSLSVAYFTYFTFVGKVPLKVGGRGCREVTIETPDTPDSLLLEK